MQVAPSVLIVKVGGHSPAFEEGLRLHGIEFMGYVFDSDYYALPNVLNLLSAPSKSELVELIMQHPLPQRPASHVEV
jgi:hypothetical protein